MSNIFISYRRDDSGPYAGRLADDLRERFGTDQVFMDLDTIEPGMDFVEVIRQAVGSCDALLAVIGDHWLTATDAGGHRRLDDPEDFVRLEIGAALDRDVRVIPLLVHGAAMPPSTELPSDLAPLARRNGMELSDRRWHYDVGQLMNVLQREFDRRAALAAGAGETVEHEKTDDVVEQQSQVEREGEEHDHDRNGHDLVPPRPAPTFLERLPLAAKAGITLAALALIALIVWRLLPPPGPKPHVNSNVVALTFPTRSLDPKGYQVGYQGKEFTIHIIDPNYPRIAIAFPTALGNVADGSLSFDFRLLNAVPSGRQVIVACRDTKGSEYRLVITPSARFFALVRTNGASSPQTSVLADYTTNVIQPDNATNHIVFSCAGDRVIAGVNGTQLADVQDATFSAGRLWVGVDTEVGVTGTVQGGFSNLFFNKKPAPPAATILVQDNFDDPNAANLPTFGHKSGRFTAQYTHSMYVIDGFRPTFSGIASAFLTQPATNTDGVLGINARLEQPTTERRIVIGCRSNGSGNSEENYRLAVTPDSQHFKLYRFSVTSTHTLAEAQSSSILTGTAWNHLVLACVGHRISASINGQQVASVTDSRLGSGTLFIGVGPMLGMTGTAKADFAHLQVIQP